jgi:uncharacterized membrane protein YagU involved in acid resistance
VIWGALVGGLLGTVVLTTVMRAAGERGLTRMDLPFLLGTAFTAERVRAKLVGYALHFVFGLVFALGYWVVFVTFDRAGIVIGVSLGVIHALFAGTALVNVILPAVHPRMGTGFDAAGSSPLLEPPGFMLANYGRQTMLVMIAAHVAYGAIVGELAARAA